MRFIISLFLLALLATFGCDHIPNQEEKDSKTVQMQQAQYATRQPVPVFDHSYERGLVIQLYQIRNRQVATHTVWRSDYGMIEGDCASVGYAIPYTTSLTNSQQIGFAYSSMAGGHVGSAAIDQAEPNGLFPSKTTSATWVPCVDEAGGIDPVYVEGKVTTYPYPVTVDYDHNRVRKAGESQVKLSAGN
jgi:hypothetical protein